jgi:beta-glucosidase/6-phospho-beta-glucosidase/beta-galactosidase
LISVAGTSDFFGLNHYTTRTVKHDKKKGVDSDVELSADPSWSSAASSWFSVNF